MKAQRSEPRSRQGELLPISSWLARNLWRAADFCYSAFCYLDAAKNLPSYLAKTNYREPDDATVNNFSDMDPDSLNFFGRLAQTPEHHAAFTGHMEAYTAWKTPWTETYDTRRLVEGAKLDDGTALVVDLGGNTGIDISRVLAKHPSLPAGSLVLQDLPEMIAKANVDPKITAMAHDFFKPQPVRGQLLTCPI